MSTTPGPAGKDAPSQSILGVDPGLRITGWGIFRTVGDTPTVDCGVIKTSRNAETSVRLRTILDGLLAAIDAHQPSALAVERPFVQVNVRSAMALGQAQAVALIAAALRDLPAYEYAPREVKQAVTGDGNAEKTAVAEALRLRLDLDTVPQPLDASDALAVAYCHYLLGGHDDLEIIEA